MHADVVVAIAAVEIVASVHLLQYFMSTNFIFIIIFVKIPQAEICLWK